MSQDEKKDNNENEELIEENNEIDESMDDNDESIYESEETDKKSASDELKEEIKQSEKLHKNEKDLLEIPKNKNFFMYLSVVLGILLIISLSTNGFSALNFSSKDKPVYTGDPIDVNFYVMSKCVYGVQAVDAFVPVLNNLEGYINLNLEYIATETSPGNFNSLFGQDGVKGDIIQLCAIKHEPEKYMDLIVCMNRNFQSIPNNWESCANELNLNINTLKTCYEGDEGKELLSESLQKSQLAGATQSPTIFINNRPYQGQRNEDGFLRAICNELNNEPTVCNEFPERNEVNLIILNDERCNDCNIVKSQTLSATEQNIFTNTNFNVEEFDYNTPEGKEIFDKYDIQKLPAFIFSSEIQNENGFSNVASVLTKLSDDSFIISPEAMSASFDPTKEICDDGIDNTGNGLIDCEDPDCANTLLCNPNLFVDCAAEFGVSSDSIVFYYSDTCPWCTLMKPSIEQLEEEGYSFVWSDSTSAQDNIMINQCFSEYMSSGVPQFICLKKNQVRSGAFADAERNADINAMRTWVDNCLS